MTPPTWSARGLDVTLLHERMPSLGLLFRRPGGRAVLAPELCRSLAHFVLYLIGDAPQPADPDTVRLAVDEQRQELLERRRADGLTAEADTELAWALRALDAIGKAAGG